MLLIPDRRQVDAKSYSANEPRIAKNKTEGQSFLNEQ